MFHNIRLAFLLHFSPIRYLTFLKLDDPCEPHLKNMQGKLLSATMLLPRDEEIHVNLIPKLSWHGISSSFYTFILFYFQVYY
jgi:hypothetical protein